MVDDSTKDIIKEVAKDAYKDLGHPVAQPTGELVGLLPRAIKAALAPLEQWILQKEYNVAETRKLLECKLQNIQPELIEPPEAYIAVPALQYISYCSDTEELRNMYANLLANSMTAVVKDGVHPSFVEIIKQLSPDEAKLMNYFTENIVTPIITVRRQNSEGTGIEIVRNFSNIGEISGCEQPLVIAKCFDNLERLGLVFKAGTFQSLPDESLYEELKQHPFVLEKTREVQNAQDEYKEVSFIESYVALTDFGIAFCKICVENPSCKCVNET